MPVNRLIRFGFPSEGESGVFGEKKGKFWRLINEVVELVEGINEGEIDTEPEDLSAEQVGILRDRLIEALDKKIRKDYANIDFSEDQRLLTISEIESDKNAYIKAPEGSGGLDLELPDSGKSFSDAHLAIQDDNLIITEKHLSFEEEIVRIAADLPWNEALSQISVLMLRHAANRTKIKNFQFADATKALIAVSRFAGFKFLDPRIGDISHLFFNGLLELKLVKQADWMFKFPAKPFSSMAANHPEELQRKSFNRPGSTREFTAYGLTKIGLENYRKDLMKLGLLKSEIDFVCGTIEKHLHAPWDEIAELAVEPDSVSPED